MATHNLAQVGTMAADSIIRRLVRIVLWIYHFLAEDPILLIGTALAIVVAAFAAHTVPHAAGFILWGVISAAIAASLWRAVAMERRR
jgi:hypothetical protein